MTSNVRPLNGSRRSSGHCAHAAVLRSNNLSSTTRHSSLVSAPCDRLLVSGQQRTLQVARLAKPGIGASGRLQVYSRAMMSQREVRCGTWGCLRLHALLHFWSWQILEPELLDVCINCQYRISTMLPFKGYFIPSAFSRADSYVAILNQYTAHRLSRGPEPTSRSLGVTSMTWEVGWADSRGSLRYTPRWLTLLSLRRTLTS